MQQVALPGKVLRQGDGTRFRFCTGEDASERNQELGKLPDTQQLASGLNGVGSLGSHKKDGLVSAHPGRENQVTSEQHTYTMKDLNKIRNLDFSRISDLSNSMLQTCPSKTSMAVDGQFTLLDSKRHDFHHVKDCSQRCHTIILPPKVVVIN